MTPTDRRRYAKQIAHLDAIQASVTRYAAAIVTQLRRAEAAGGWPERIRLVTPRTDAQRAALDVAIVSLRRDLPETIITMEPERLPTVPARQVVRVGATWRLPRLPHPPRRFGPYAQERANDNNTDDAAGEP